MSTARFSYSPIDEDLQRLYNDVWAGFAEEEQESQPNGNMNHSPKDHAGESVPQPPPKPYELSVSQGGRNGRCSSQRFILWYR